MYFSVLRRHGAALLGMTVALTVGSTALKATGNTLTATPSTATITCNTQTGTTPVSIVIKPVTPLSGSSTTVVTYASPSGGLTVTPSTATLTSATNTTGVTFTVGFAAGCAGVTNAATPTIQFKQGGTNDVTATITTNLAATVSGLTPNPASVTVSCVASGSSPYSYAPGPAQTVAVSSTAANLGSPFTIVSSGGTAPAGWLTVSSYLGGTATTSSSVSFTVQAAAGCNSLAPGQTSTTTVHLANAPAPDKTIAVTLQVVSPSPLTAIAPVTITYVKGSGAPGKASVNVSSISVPNAFFAVDSSSLPSWLTVDSAGGTAPKTIQFSSTPGMRLAAAGNL
jgi:hypothetical protein